MGQYLNWLIHSEAGLWVRIGIGAAIFAFLAVVDWRRNGRAARRWREYLFLLACVGVALAYGAINDQLTVGISWEYFGGLGHYGLLNWLSEDLAAIWHEGLFRPARFMTVYGIHLGGYVGGALATVWAVIAIRRGER